MSKKSLPAQPARPRHKSYHDQIDPGAVSHQRVTAVLNAKGLDLAMDRLTDTDIYVFSRQIAVEIFGSFSDIEDAYHMALCDVHAKMGDEIFNRLEGTGAAFDRRLVLAAYFLGVRCGRLAPAAGGAR